MPDTSRLESLFRNRPWDMSISLGNLTSHMLSAGICREGQCRINDLAGNMRECTVCRPPLFRVLHDVQVARLRASV